MENKKNVNVKLIINELHKAFNYINRDYFNNELPEPAILIQSRGNKKLVLGWCTVGKVWKNSTTQEEKYEINLVAEAVNRGLFPVMSTLMHEMVHLYNLENDIKDTSRGNTYHNKAFKEEAEKRGLIIEHDEKIGWSLTSLTPALMNRIKSYGLNEEAFTLGRMDLTVEEKEKGKKKSSSRKYICPECGTTIRASKDVFVLCGLCTKIEENKIVPMLKEVEPSKDGATEKEVNYVCNDCGSINTTNEKIDESVGTYICSECGSTNTEIINEPNEEPVNEDLIENENETEVEPQVKIIEVDDKLIDEDGNLVDVKQGFIDVFKAETPQITGNNASKTENTGWDENRIKEVLKIAQEDIEIINKNEIEKHTFDCTKIPMKFSKMKSKYAYVHSSYKTIRGKKKINIDYIKFSTSHLENDSDYEIVDTIRHEYIHAWLDTKRNKNQYHNELFKRYCDKMGVKHS